MASETGQKTAGSYASVNGLEMYYEIHGSDRNKRSLVLIHGSGSAIQTTFGAILPQLSKERKIIAVELQGHGHTSDIDRPLHSSRMLKTHPHLCIT